MNGNPRDWLRNSIFSVPWSISVAISAVVIGVGYLVVNALAVKSGPSICETSINADQVRGHLGESKSVIGMVVSVAKADGEDGSPTFLNLDADYPDPNRFTVVVWGKDAGKFDDLADYDGKFVCVRGVLREYQGAVQTDLSNPDNIEVLEREYDGP